MGLYDDLKITQEDIETNGVCAAPDILQGTANENKRLFDRLIREAVSGKYNALLQELDSMGVGKIIQRVEDGEIKYLRMNADNVLEVSSDGETWEAVSGSSGHIIEAADGSVLPQRSRLRFASGSVQDVNGVTVVTGESGDVIYRGAISSNTDLAALDPGLYRVDGVSNAAFPEPSKTYYGGLLVFDGIYKGQLLCAGTSGVCGVYARRKLTNASSWTEWIDASTPAAIKVSGILKGNGSGGVSAAVAGTDYVAPAAIKVSGILKGNGSGGVSAAVAGTDYVATDDSRLSNARTPTAHNQAASTITAGTFAGRVNANTSGEDYDKYCLRNSRLSSDSITPTNDGEIRWTYG